MIADLRGFRTTDMNLGNVKLKEYLKALNLQASALLQTMDVVTEKINFEPDEIDKWVNLRKAILDFKTLEVNPNVPQNVMISVDNMDKLHDVYGAYSEAAVNKIINDLITEADERFKEKISKGKLQSQLAKIEPMN